MSVFRHTSSVLLFVLTLCVVARGDDSTATPQMKDHPTFDLKKWTKLFPLSHFEKPDRPRHFSTTKPGDPLDLRKASGPMVQEPADLACLDQVRGAVGKANLTKAIPVDLFVWAWGPPTKPYLTKTGGVPHRRRDKPWPKSDDGDFMTFVVQFCFTDSRDISPRNLPGDVMLVFFRSPGSFFECKEDVVIEWSQRDLKNPMTAENCPAPSFAVPELSGVIHRTHEYPADSDVFRKHGHYQYWLFATTQSTSIGAETFFIQNDPRRKNEKLLCALSYMLFGSKKDQWELTNVKQWPPDGYRGPRGEFNDFFLMFGDAGCMYFLVDADGQVRCSSDCY